MTQINSQLNISHLKMICTINDCETVKEAAERLQITQPALSNRIREAERRLNTKLFARRGRKLIITTAGKRLLQSARKILDELARVELDITKLTEGIEQVIRIGLPHYASFRWLPFVIDYFTTHFPKIELEIISDAASQPVNALYQGEIDVAFISSAKPVYKPELNDFQAHYIHSDELVACVGPAHKFANRKHLLPEDFTDETYITNAALPEKDREYELFFKPNNIAPNKVVQVGFNEAILELVNMNMGLSIFSRRSIQQNSHADELVRLPLGDNGVHIYWHLVAVDNDSITDIVTHLTKLLVEFFNQVEPSVT